MAWLNAVLIVFSLLMLGGGVGGYVSNGSVWSAVSGVVSFVLLSVSVWQARTNKKVGYGLASVTCLVLVGIFFERFLRTGKAMPALGLMGLSLLVLTLLVVGHLLDRKSPAA